MGVQGTDNMCRLGMYSRENFVDFVNITSGAVSLAAHALKRAACNVVPVVPDTRLKVPGMSSRKQLRWRRLTLKSD